MDSLQSARRLLLTIVAVLLLLDAGAIAVLLSPTGRGRDALNQEYNEVLGVFDRTAASGITSGQYLALSISAADELVDTPVPEIRTRLLPELARILPGLREPDVVDFFVTREREATFRPAPGSRSLRAATLTRAPGLVLAGAWTDTGWPATMEGAVRSGESAARAVIGQSAMTAEVAV